MTRPPLIASPAEIDAAKAEEDGGRTDYIPPPPRRDRAIYLVVACWALWVVTLWSHFGGCR